MASNPHLSDIRSVLLLGTSNILALPVIRSIGAEMPQVSIHTISYRDEHSLIPEFSRYVHGRHYIEPYQDEEVFYLTLLQKIKEIEAEILLPIDESDVRKLASIQDRLRDHIHLPPLPSPELFDSLVYKDRLNDLLIRYNLPHPVTHKLGETDVAELEPSFFPCLLKPFRGSAGCGIKKIDGPDQLRAELKHTQSEEFILQEIVPGTKIICNLLAEKGEICAFNIQEGLESRNYSFSTTIKFVENQPVTEVVHELIQRTGYSGLANLDFILDDRDGKARLIDFNPRFWSSLSGSKAAGVDFTRMTCMAAMGESLRDRGEASIHYGHVYHMGRSSLKHLYRSLAKPVNAFKNPTIHTDLRERIIDPLPEILRLLHR